MTEHGTTTIQNGDKLTEKQLAQDFDRIDQEVRERARRFETEGVEPISPLTIPDGVVIEPVYAFTTHATS